MFQATTLSQLSAFIDTMRIPRIYTPQALSASTSLALDDEAAHHVARVLRMQSGNSLRLFNGDGSEYHATIISADKKSVQVRVEEISTVDNESPLKIHLGIAISKGERMDWVIQKATELGATEITPLISERVEVRLHGEREEKKLLHWQSIAISACEQCARNRIPTIHAPATLAAWLDSIACDANFVLHHRSETALEARPEKPGSVALLIGPEGGLSDAEIMLAERKKFAPLRLGPRVLRTETAPLAALSVLQFLWGDLRV